MNRQLIFATGNQNKVDEIRSIVPDGIDLLSLADLNFHKEVPETQNTLEGNALQKAQYVFDMWKKDCFSEDTGLEIEALDGAPGVLTARFAGPEKDPAQNMNKVLELLKDIEDRQAQFRACIALILDEKTYLFEGIVRGHIAETKRGTGGFGYDPIFIPEGYNKTFAEMSQNEKKSLSHRSRAFAKMLAYLEEVLG